MVIYSVTILNVKPVSTQSDKNLKNNIQTLENCLVKIEKLRGVSFE